MQHHQLLGAWKLLSFEYRAEDGTSFFPYGRDALGILIYEPNGYMSGMIGKNNRPRISVEDLGRLPDSEKITLSEGFISYSGEYEILEDRVIH